jgi:hypothetical protein
MERNPQPMGNGFLKIPHEFINRIKERIEPTQRMAVTALTISLMTLCERQRRRLHGGEPLFVFEARLEEIGAEAATTRNRVSKLLLLMDLGGLIESEKLRSSTRIKLLFADPPQEQDAPLPHDEAKKGTRVKRSAAGTVTDVDIEEIEQLYGPQGVDVKREFAKATAWIGAHPHKKLTKRFLVNWLNRVNPSPRERLSAARDAGEFTGERLCPDFDGTIE